jgi:hypothetical protein
MNKLTNMIGKFQSKFKAGIPMIVDLLTDGEADVRYSAVSTIRTLGERGK